MPCARIVISPPRAADFVREFALGIIAAVEIIGREKERLSAVWELSLCPHTPGWTQGLHLGIAKTL